MKEHILGKRMFPLRKLLGTLQFRQDSDPGKD